MLGNSKAISKRHMMSRLLCACLVCALALSSACAAGSTAPSASASPEATVNTEAAVDPNAPAAQSATADPNATPTITPTPELVDLSQYQTLPLPQLDPTPDGEEIAVLHTDLGDMKIRFFPDFAPNAVQNFKTLAKSNYFDGNIFNQVVANQYVRSGDPTGTGTGGQSMWGQPFPAETSPCLHNIYGAVTMMRGQQDNTQGSQFLIVANKSLDDAAKAELEAYKDKQDQVMATTSDGTKVPYAQVFPTKILDKYIQGGGMPGIDLYFTVFGQVIDGFDALDKIAAVQTSQEDATKDKPLADIKINSVTFENYKAK